MTFTSANKQRKHLTNENRYYLIIISICILVLGVTIIILYSSKTKNTDYNNKPVASIQQNINSTTTASKPQPIVLNEEEISIDDCINRFNDIYTHIQSKLYQDNSDEFREVLEKYAQTKSNTAYDSYLSIKKYAHHIEEFTKHFDKLNGLAIGIEDTNYNKVLYEMAQLLYTANKWYRIESTSDGMDGNFMVMLNDIEGRFIYQQLHINLITVNILRITQSFLSVIKKRLEFLTNNHIIITLLRELYLQLNTIKDELFEKYDSTLEFKYKDQNITVENIMTCFKKYNSFLLLNIYVVFMHIFEPGPIYEITKTRPYFIKYFLIRNTDILKDDIETKKEKIIKNCKNILNLSLLVGDETTYFRTESHALDSCCLCLFEQICLVS